MSKRTPRLCMASPVRSRYWSRRPRGTPALLTRFGEFDAGVQDDVIPMNTLCIHLHCLVPDLMQAGVKPERSEKVPDTASPGVWGVVILGRSRACVDYRFPFFERARRTRSFPRS